MALTYSTVGNLSNRLLVIRYPYLSKVIKCKALLPNHDWWVMACKESEKNLVECLGIWPPIPDCPF